MGTKKGESFHFCPLTLRSNPKENSTKSPVLTWHSHSVLGISGIRGTVLPSAL